ncbi:hypothetical protein PIB30_031480 [Stylosanthes scabra]|uniref:Uncharacterized protein n=1 Tax=Stylosanthes scabra TaxID=79078 RepID=A0ABU6VAS0_9FABA|nr:hypothetical protein [Stylosanthes scabra]
MTVTLISKAAARMEEDREVEEEFQFKIALIEDLRVEKSQPAFEVCTEQVQQKLHKVVEIDGKVVMAQTWDIAMPVLEETAACLCWCALNYRDAATRWKV